MLAGLAPLPFPIFLHAKHSQISEVYARHGIAFPPFQIHETHSNKSGSDIEGVLLCASQCKRSKWWEELTRKRRVETAYVSGWALGAHPRRFGTDAAFPLSDHAGYDDLLEYVRLSGARQIWTTHGFDAEFASDLRTRGYDAAPLRQAKHEAKRASTAMQLSLF